MPPYRDKLKPILPRTAGKKMEPSDVRQIAAKPMDNGPAIHRNRSEGELMAMNDSEPTIPPVSAAAWISTAPPNAAKGAMVKPVKPAKEANAKCFSTVAS